MRAKDIMRPASATIHVDAGVREALIRFPDFDSDYLIVLDGDQVVGNLARSIVASLDAESPGVSEEMVGNLMDPQMRSCRLDDTVEDISRLFSRPEVRLVVVVDERQQIHGCISREDILGPERRLGIGKRHRPEARGRSGGRAKPGPSDKLRVYSQRPHLRHDDD